MNDSKERLFYEKVCALSDAKDPLKKADVEALRVAKLLIIEAAAKGKRDLIVEPYNESVAKVLQKNFDIKKTYSGGIKGPAGMFISWPSKSV